MEASRADSVYGPACLVLLLFVLGVGEKERGVCGMLDGCWMDAGLLDFGSKNGCRRSHYLEPNEF